MGNREFIGYVVGSLVSMESIPLDHIPYELVLYAKKNKVLYQLGLFDDRVKSFWEWRELDRRWKAQLDALKSVSRLTSEGVEVLVIKTFKSFNYVPDDIDLLVINKDDMGYVIEYFKKQGFSLLKKGTPEITLRKLYRGTFVDLDIHDCVAAGHYRYMDNNFLWRYRTRYCIDDIEVYTASPCVDLALVAGHSVLKELYILLSDIYHVYRLWITKRQVVERAIVLSKRIGLYKPLSILINEMYRVFFRREKLVYPYKIPYQHIIASYIENLEYRIGREGLSPVKELLLTPGSKGIKLLFKYILGG